MYETRLSACGNNQENIQEKDGHNLPANLFVRFQLWAQRTKFIYWKCDHTKNEEYKFMIIRFSQS